METIGKDATKEDILNNLLDEYDVDKATAERDVDEFINKLKGAELLAD